MGHRLFYPKNKHWKVQSLVFSSSNSTMASRLTVTALVLIALATVSLQTSASSVGKFIDETITSHKIVIFSKTYCPYVYTHPSFLFWCVDLIPFLYLWIMGMQVDRSFKFEVFSFWVVVVLDLVLWVLSFSVMGLIKMLFFSSSFIWNFSLRKERISRSELMWPCSRLWIAHYMWIVIDNVVFTHFVCANICGILEASFCSLFGCMLFGIASYCIRICLCFQ